MGVRFSGLHPDIAPTLEDDSDGPVRAHIVFRSGPYRLIAERDLRSWQSLLLPYTLIDVDFDSPTEEFKPENEAERAKIKLHNFSRTNRPMVWRGAEYGVFARAFLAIEKGVSLIELMSLYRDALKARAAGRSIDAYNQFYLFIETQFCKGRTGTLQATDQLLASAEFMSALEAVANETRALPNFGKVSLASLKNWPAERRGLVKEIVELRGRLRHHSLGSPHRWDPNRQEAFEKEARFLSLVAHHLAFPKATGILWEPNLLDQFLTLAKEMHMTIEIHVLLTIRENDVTQDVGLDMTFPQPSMDSQLARAVLAKAIEIFEQKSPAAELFAIRAWTKRNRAELFRYDIGPSLGR